LFSRTRDFADDFAHSLAKFDAVLLMDIYPAREEPIAGVDSKWLLDKIDIKHKALVNKSTIVAEIKRYNYPILITMGAGDIGSEVKRIKKELVYAS
jgi:UDP-N-acetylmuramate--alanine ligase